MIATVSGVIFSFALAGLLLLWVQRKGWRIPGVWRLLMLDATTLHWLTRPEPRLDRAVDDLRELLSPNFTYIPPVRAVVLNTMGCKTRDVMFGLITDTLKRTGRRARPVLLFLPDYHFEECDDGDLRILVAHEFGHIMELSDPLNQFVLSIGKVGEDFCHEVAAEIYGPEQTLLTLKKFGVPAFCKAKES